VVATRPPLITAHWFREGPVRPDGSDGYWICGFNGCGQHRGDHVQAEGQWLLPLHAFVPQRHAPSRCKPCGRHRRHTAHTPWTLPEQPGPRSTP
jgi:hypothetical protein